MAGAHACDFSRSPLVSHRPDVSKDRLGLIEVVAIVKAAAHFEVGRAGFMAHAHLVPMVQAPEPPFLFTKDRVTRGVDYAPFMSLHN
jgi:hypothetical protein